MNGFELAAVIGAALLGSHVISVLLERILLRNNDIATVSKTKAETADILAKASNTAVEMMELNLRVAQDRILALEARVTQLEGEIHEYYRRHGPLDRPVP